MMLLFLNAVFASIQVSITLAGFLGISPEEDETVTEEEIRMMVAAGSEKGVIDLEENEMIQNVLDFNDVCVEKMDLTYI